MEKVTRTDAEWREHLTPEEYAVLRKAGTEAPFTGEYTDTKTEGVYRCRACGAELFRSDAKFESHCGWPSFYQPTESDAVVLIEDRSLGMTRRADRWSGWRPRRATTSGCPRTFRTGRRTRLSILRRSWLSPGPPRKRSWSTYRRCEETELFEHQEPVEHQVE